ADRAQSGVLEALQSVEELEEPPFGACVLDQPRWKGADCDERTQRILRAINASVSAAPDHGQRPIGAEPGGGTLAHALEYDRLRAPVVLPFLGRPERPELRERGDDGTSIRARAPRERPRGGRPVGRR